MPPDASPFGRWKLRREAPVRVRPEIGGAGAPDADRHDQARLHRRIELHALDVDSEFASLPRL